MQSQTVSEPDSWKQNGFLSHGLLMGRLYVCVCVFFLLLSVSSIFDEGNWNCMLILTKSAVLSAGSHSEEFLRK